MPKYVASFRLSDTPSLGELSYDERYDLLMSFFGKQNSFKEESTTSLVYFQSSSDVVELGNNIIRECQLSFFDEILLFKFDLGLIANVIRVKNKKLYTAALDSFLKS